MSNAIYTAVFSGCLITLSIVSGVLLNGETNIFAQLFFGSLLVLCPIISMLILFLSLKQEVAK